MPELNPSPIDPGDNTDPEPARGSLTDEVCHLCKQAYPEQPEKWNRLRLPLVRNSLSRRGDFYICNDCGMAEAFADHYGTGFVEARQKLEIHLASFPKTDAGRWDKA